MNLEATINQAAKGLPSGWMIEIRVERGAGWVDLVSPEGRTKADWSGSIGEQVAAALAHTQAAAQSKHKLERAVWLAEIQRLAVAECGFDPGVAARMDWGDFAQNYYLDFTPAEALRADADLSEVVG